MTEKRWQFRATNHPKAVTAVRWRALWVANVSFFLALAPRLCAAALTFQFATGPGHFAVQPGNSVAVTVHLVETTTAPDTSRLVAEQGLQQAQVTVVRTPGAASDPAKILSYDVNMADFDDITGPIENVFAPDELDITQLVDLFATEGPTGNLLGDGVRRIRMATLEIEAGGIVGESTEFEIKDNPLFDETFTFDLLSDPLDALIAPSRFTVSVVPEPSTLCLLVALAAGLSIATWRPMMG